MAQKLHLLIIDPQVDFMDRPGSALAVPGAMNDIQRLANLVERLGSRIDDIHVTLDTHHLIHIANPIMWVNSQGQHPDPFSLITLEDVMKGTWKAYNPGHQSIVENYVEKLASAGRYILCIWPPHCLIGREGHNVEPILANALLDWEQREFGMIDYVTKGSNWKTEHYSAVMADVPDAEDPTTGLNVRLIETLQEADIIALSGQALSHCVANTVTDIADNFGEDNIKKLVLLEDASSSVAGFEFLGEEFLEKLKARGMKTVKCEDFLV